MEVEILIFHMEKQKLSMRNYAAVTKKKVQTWKKLTLRNKKGNRNEVSHKERIYFFIDQIWILAAENYLGERKV